MNGCLRASGLYELVFFLSFWVRGEDEEYVQYETEVLCSCTLRNLLYLGSFLHLVDNGGGNEDPKSNSPGFCMIYEIKQPIPFLH